MQESSAFTLNALCDDSYTSHHSSTPEVGYAGYVSVHLTSPRIGEIMSRKLIFRESHKNEYWYVAVPPNRPTNRRRISLERWIREVDARHYRDEHGNRVCHNGLNGIIPVDCDEHSEWKQLLRSLVLAKHYRMPWEPVLPPDKPRPVSTLW